MKRSLASIFSPRSVAVVGVSPNSEGRTRANFLEGLVAHEFHKVGQLYPVNRNASVISGLKCYKSLLECPDPVDHVIVQVRAEAVLDVIHQCINKNVRSVHIYTSGFRESGHPDGLVLEQRIAELASENGIRVIGPNSLGLYAPGSRLSFAPNLPRDAGHVFILSQSGSLTGTVIGALARREVYTSKAVSFGNACDVDAAELLEFAAEDPESSVVAGYIEGTRNGRRLFEGTRRAGRAKPTILLNGGSTSWGSASAATHTGSLAVPDRLFDAMAKQAGAVKVSTLGELVDTVVAFSSSLLKARGNRVSIVGAGGGQSVLGSDLVARYGMVMPRFGQDLVADLQAILGTPPGASLLNPIDQAIMRVSNDPGLAPKAIERVAAVGVIDVIVLLVGGGWGGHWRAAGGSTAEALAEDFAEKLGAIQEATGVPIAAIAGDGDGGLADADSAFQRAARRHSLAFFPSTERGVPAIAKVLGWLADR